MPVSYLLSNLWNWILGSGLNLAILLIVAMLVPRIGRLIMRVVTQRVEEDTDRDTGKNHLAFAGVGVYVGQIIAYFILIILVLQEFGFSLAGAAIPATVASAAVGFGAQSIIADFLAGFFILTEKQFGVGDWVRFEGNGIKVEGTVTEVTMRATRIRTIAQETVIIPNSTAKVCINNSNNWSRAVVVIPVPLLGSENIEEVVERSEAATRRALAQEDIAPEVLGDLDVHPAVDVQPPTVVGMPWMVSMRFLVKVTAGNQWLVERAIRLQIVDEFWAEYGSATTTSGAVIDTLTIDPDPVHPVTGTALVDAPATPGTAPSRASEASGETSGDTGGVDGAPEAEELSPGNPMAELDDAPTTVIRAADGGETLVVPLEDVGEVEDSQGVSGFFRTDSYEKRWQKLLSLGGRVRMSSTLLVLALLALFLLKGATVEPSEDWVSQNQQEVVEETTTTEVPTPTEATQLTEPGTPTTVPTTTTGAPTGTGTTAVSPTTGAATPTGQNAPAPATQTTQAPTTQAPATAPQPAGATEPDLVPAQ